MDQQGQKNIYDHWYEKVLAPYIQKFLQAPPKAYWFWLGRSKLGKYDTSKVHDNC